MQFPEQYLDSTASYEGTLYPSGNESLEARYDGTEVLRLLIWPGDDRAAGVTSDTSIVWIDHAADNPTFRVTIAREDIEDLPAGTYHIRGIVAPGIEDRDLWAPDSTIEFLPVAGATVAPATYCTYDDMLRLSGDLLTNLQEEADQSGFVEQRHEALLWTHQTVISRARVGVWFALGADEPVDAVWDYIVADLETEDAFVSVIQGYLDDGSLITDGDADRAMVAANAMYALSEVYRRQIGRDESYGGKADYWHGRAVKKLFSWVARIDTEGDGSMILRVPNV